MEGSTNTAVLIDAKREYLAQLSACVAPTVAAIVDEMWASCRAQKKPLIAFMTRLKGVPDVNNSVIATWTTQVTDKCPWFSELLAAVFVSYVKVLTSVRLNHSKPKIKLRIPSNETFVHSVMVDYAQELYSDPYLIQRTDNGVKGAKSALIQKCVEVNVRNLLPVKDILNAYVCGTAMNNNEFDPEPPDSPSIGERDDAGDDAGDDAEDDVEEAENDVHEPEQVAYESAGLANAQVTEVREPVEQAVQQPVLQQPVEHVLQQPVAQPVLQQPVAPPMAEVQEHRTVPLGKAVGYDDAEDLE